jgi:hypothetical protein
LFAVFSPAGLVWLAVPAIVALVVLVPRGLVGSARIAAAVAALIALLSVPSIAIARTFIDSANGGNLTSSTSVANLGHPLNTLQVFGIWPAADFRDRPHDAPFTYALLAILGVGAVAGLVLARRRRALGVPLYLATAAGGFLLFLAFDHLGLSSPWVNAKAMAEASPALVVAGVAGAAALFETGRRVEGAVIGTAVAVGVLWSNALAYSGAWLAPRAALAELQAIGHRFGGQGPALTTDSEVYGGRHFLRNLAAEGASDRRRLLIPLLDGQGLGKGQTADLDQFRLGGILVFKTVVLARSPAESRPPSVYHLVWSGRYYDVWQRPDAHPRILEHVPLGNSVQPGGVPACSEVQRLAKAAGRSGRLVAPPRTPNVVVDFTGVPLPAGWTGDAGGHLFPTKAGAVAKDFTVPNSGRYALWIGGSFRDSLRVYVDGRLVADARDRLTEGPGYQPLGSAELSAGVHRLVLRYGGPGLLPGSGGSQFGLGPFILSRSPEDVPVVSVPSAAARTLCGRNLDWIEALGS